MMKRKKNNNSKKTKPMPPHLASLVTRNKSTQLQPKVVGVSGKLVLAGKESEPQTNLEYLKRSILEKQKEKIKSTQTQIKNIADPTDRMYLENELETLKERWRQLQMTLYKDSDEEFMNLHDNNIVLTRMEIDSLLESEGMGGEVEEDYDSVDNDNIDNVELSIQPRRPRERHGIRRISRPHDKNVKYVRPPSTYSVEQPKFHNFFQPLAIRFASDRIAKKSSIASNGLPAVHYQHNESLNEVAVDRENLKYRATNYVTRDDNVYSMDVIEAQKFLDKQYLSTTKPVNLVVNHRMRFKRATSRTSPTRSRSPNNNHTDSPEDPGFTVALSCSPILSPDNPPRSPVYTSRHRKTSPPATPVNPFRGNVFDADLTKEERRMTILHCLNKDRTRRAKSMLGFIKY